MVKRFILTAACLAAPFVSGFAPSSVVQQQTSTLTTSNVVVAPRVAASSLAAVMSDEADSKIYKPNSKETPKVLGGVKIGLRKLVVITGASSGLGLSTTIALAKTGKYHIIMACRDLEKAKKSEHYQFDRDLVYFTWVLKRID